MEVDMVITLYKDEEGNSRYRVYAPVVDQEDDDQEDDLMEVTWQYKFTQLYGEDEEGFMLTKADD